MRPKLDGLTFLIIPQDRKSWLKRDFEEEEISMALSNCMSDKASGPNDFDFAFIRAAWDFLKEDFCGYALKIP